MSAFVDINNPSNYKNCSKKQYEIYVCMPPKNTVVINKLEQADVVKMLNGKTYFTVDELEHMQKNGDGRFNIISQAVNSGRAYLVSDKTPFVLCGTSGELWTISPDKLAKTYNFLQGGQPLRINQQSLGQRMKNGLLDWTSVRTSPQATAGQNMACFVPSSQRGQIQTSWGAVLNINGVGISHGKGDFVVCAKSPNGRPNLADRWVVNGEIFAATYNNQGWTDCLSSSSVRSITIDSLPKLVPQQAVNNDKGVDFNVFKQKCDTIMKELQKIYKFNVKSNTYETVKDYSGFAYEVYIKFDCYVAKYVVGGNFSHTHSVKSQTSDGMTTKTVTTDETYVWFACSAIRSNSAIAMSIRPKTDGLYLGGWAFPNNSDTEDITEWRCRVGTIKDINCVEEVKLFKEKCGNRDVFIDNRKNSSNNDIDVQDFLSNIQRSSVQGGIGIQHVLEEVYSRLTDDTLKEKVHLCHKIYAGTSIGCGSMSLHYASYIEAVNKGGAIGNGVLSHKMNLKSLIKYLVSVCQHDEENSYYAQLILGSLSRTALTEAIMKLFYDNNNPNLSVLWKRLDLQYMLKSGIKIYFPKGYDDVNNERVCIDFNLDSFKDGVFVRCVYTASGNYGFDFIPKKPIEEYGVGATFSFDKDYDNYIEICKQLRDSCYMCLTDWTNSSRTFIENLPEYLIKTDFKYLDLLGGKVDYFFRIISNNLDANKSDYNRETNTYKIKFAVGSNETRVIYMSEDDAHTVSVKCTLNGVTFEKSYKLSIKRSVDINAMLIFSDICKVLKIHPAKELLKSKRLWDNVTQTVSEKFSSGNHRKFDSVDVSSKIDKITPVSINLDNTKYEILLRFYNNEKVIGERVLVVDFNYKNFDMRTANSRSIKALGGLKYIDDITDMTFSMRYKYSLDTVKVTDYTSSIDISDITNEFYWATYELINSTKKYQVK